MLLAVDVGNSNIVIGVHDGDQWVVLSRVDTHPVLETPDYKQKIQNLLSEKNVNRNSITSAIISSVVPEVSGSISKSLADLFHCNPILLNAETDTGITLGADKPERVGTDLIADAVGAYNLVQDTCIVVDFGTATTVMAIEKPALLSGVAICIGLKVSIEALVGNTAQLQDIPLKVPDSPLGKNTVEAMQSGLVLGHLCMVEGLIDRVKKEIGDVPVVATGGLVSMLAPHTAYFDYVEPMLTMDGLRIVAERKGKRQS